MNNKTKNIIKSVFSAALTLLFSAVPYLSQAAWVGNTNNATLFLSPDAGTYKANANFSVDIMLNTHSQNVVVVAAYINYNTSLFQVVSVDTTSSVFTTEAENVIDATNGVVKITRGIPSANHVNTASGKVATLNIKGLTDVTPSVDNFTFQFTAGSTVDSNIILDDGLGTDIISGVDNGRYTIDGTSPANVTGFSAVAGDSQITLSWTNPTSDFSGVKILRKTGSYPSNITDGTTVYDNNGTSYADTSLVNGTAYYYKAYSHDVVLNYSSGVQATATPQDGIAPNAINTLSATALNSNSVKLDWTATGDDGSTGTAASYDVRYSTSAITAGNFTSATPISNKPTPKASGSAETMTVSGLAGNTTYYFAIKAVDEIGNIGTISKVPSALTYKTSDFNNDRIINSVDFGILMSYWNYTTKPTADINQDGIVNSIDFGIMMSQWG